MGKKWIFLLVVLILPLISPINLNVEKQSSNEVFINGLNMPVVFELKITNLGATNNFKIYNLVGLELDPENIFLRKGESKEIEFLVTPLDEIKSQGPFTFLYTIRTENGSEVDKTLTFNVIDLKDAFEIGADEFDPDSNSLNVYIKNKINFDFFKLNAKFSSPFFDLEEDFSLFQNEKKSFEVNLNNEKFKELMAGFYTINAEITAKDEKANVEGILRFVEKDIVTISKKDYGFIVNTRVITKTNKGNVISPSETILKKNILSRLFTSFSPVPDIVERKGFLIYYTWNTEINPGENFEIVVKTNWLFPLLIIFFIITIIILAKQYSKTNLNLKKKISFVHAKGGEFALKVSISVHAKKYIEKIKIVDRLPPLVKIHEKFGGEKPLHVNEKTRKLEWDFDRLDSGETRVISYIIYSKIGILGKFALPSAKAVYERDGKILQSESNRAFFMAEQGREKN
jgi:hypothetical protein